MEHDAIAVVEFGGQYAHLIATKVRRLGVRADIRHGRGRRVLPGAGHPVEVARHDGVGATN